MSLQDLAPTVNVQLVNNRLSGSGTEITNLGQTFYIAAIVGNLLPDTMYMAVFEREADGYWVGFQPVDEYHNKIFHSGDGTMPVTLVLAHPNWGPADGAPTTYTGRVHVRALTNPGVQAYSNTIPLEWTWDTPLALDNL